MNKILFICHGNICRSTMAQFVMEHLVCKCGLEREILCDSAATSREEVGRSPHQGTISKMREVGISCHDHRSRQLVPTDYEKFNYIVGMDQENLSGIYRLLLGEKGYGWSWDPVTSKQAQKADPDGKVHLLLEYAGLSRDIADPWYTGNFDQTYKDVLLGCTGLLNAICEGRSL